MIVYCPSCGQPLQIIEIFRASESLSHNQGDCDNCNSRYHWLESKSKIVGFSDITYQRKKEKEKTK